MLLKVWGNPLFSATKNEFTTSQLFIINIFKYSSRFIEEKESVKVLTERYLVEMWRETKRVSLWPCCCLRVSESARERTGFWIINVMRCLSFRIWILICKERKRGWRLAIFFSVKKWRNDLVCCSGTGVWRWYWSRVYWACSRPFYGSEFVSSAPFFFLGLVLWNNQGILIQFNIV
jgi:hypothetical protein